MSTIFAVGDELMFLGTVALLNSLYLTRNMHRVVLLDAGFSARQLAALAGHCEIVAKPGGAAGHPTLLKSVAALGREPGTFVFLDTDAIVTGSLAPVVEAAEAGAVCAFPDPDRGRFFEAWSAIFGLREPLRREPYVSAHLVAFDSRRRPGLLERWHECSELLRTRRVLAHKHDVANPVHAGDQDALNALLMSEVPAGAVELVPAQARAHSWEARASRVLDPRTLASERGGERLLYVHAGNTPKPWQPEARGRVRADAYLVLMRRLLCDRTLPVQVPAGEPRPLWLRRGAAGAAALHAIGAANAGRDRAWWVALLRRLLPQRVYDGLRAVARHPRQPGARGT